MIPTKRLKYEKYNNCDNVIIIDLHNGYSVIAIWGQVDNTFTTTLHLKEKTTDKWSLIEIPLEFIATRSTINSAILKQVSKYLNEDFFDFYIEREEYEFRCAEIGCNLLDQESKGDD